MIDGNFIGSNIYLAIPIVFLAGIVASFGPCIMTTLPVIIGYMGNSNIKTKKKSLIYSLVFVLGMTITFVIIGIATSYLGMIFIAINKYVYVILSIILIISGLNLLGVINLKKNNNTCEVPKKPENLSLLKIFSLGLFSGLVATPCATPVLASVLAVIASSRDVFIGIILLVSFSLGHSLIIILAGVSQGLLNNIISSERYNNIGRILKIILAFIILGLGFILFYIGI